MNPNMVNHLGQSLLLTHYFSCTWLSVHDCITLALTSRKRRRTASDEEDVSSDSSKSSYEGESDSEVDERQNRGATELSPTEKAKKKREKPVTR